MKKITIITFFYTLISYTQNPNLEWVNQFGIEGINEAFAITTDMDGNLLVTGRFQNTIDFDPSLNVYNLTASGYGDSFVAKFAPNGDLIWVVQNKALSSGYSVGIDIVTDNEGQIYLTGWFNSTVDFDPSSSTENLIGLSDDIFIQKLDSTGNLIWVKEIQGNIYERTHSIAIDPTNHVYITGWFSGTVDFDPSSNIFEFVTSNGPKNIYIAKYTSNGDFQWAKQLQGLGYEDQAGDLNVDLNGDIYVTGSFNGETDFDPSNSTFYLSPNNYGNSTMFILKLNSNGEFVWAKKVEGLNNSSVGSDLIVDSLNNLIITGGFKNTVDFNTGSGIEYLTSLTSVDKFILKLDSDGNFIWVRHISDNLINFYYITYETSIAIDDNDNIYLTGKFDGTIDFDLSTSEDDLLSNGGEDIFISKFNSNGEFIWAVQMGGPYNEQGLSMLIDNSNNLYTIGIFEGTVDFDPSINEESLTSLGSTDIFLQKLNTINLSVNEINDLSKAIIYPNPSEENLSVRLPSVESKIEIKILDATGKVIQSSYFHNTDLINLSMDFNAGIYFLELQTSEDKSIITLIKK